MNEHRVTLLVLLDLSSAFDTVSHEILINRLYTQLGVISRNVHQGMVGYLRNLSFIMVCHRDHTVNLGVLAQHQNRCKFCSCGDTKKV